MTDLQDRIQAAIDALVGSGIERGIQVAAFADGVQIVDAVAGVADPATGLAVTAQTAFHNFSIGKGVTATIAHLLVERGAFGYDTPVVALWPEFGAHGKSAVTVRHVLTHAAGVPAIPAGFTVDDLCDWTRVCGMIADSELWWEPGTRTGYHAYTFGFLVGEIVRRATGRRISQILRDEVSGPLGVADELWFGIPADQQHRLAVLQDAPAPSPPGPPARPTGPGWLAPTAALGNDPRILAADIPSCAKTSATAIAKMYAALLGPVDGVRLVSPETLVGATDVAFTGTDQLFGNPAVWGLGYALGGPADWTDPQVFGMAGAGGSWAGADRTSGKAMAVTKNVISGDLDTTTRIVSMLSDCHANSFVGKAVREDRAADS